MEGLAIGRFRITRKLGAGGMAEVYEARHELMNRYAAVKLLRPEMSARDIIVQRFFQEAQAAASIEHPGIVHVYDVGYTHDGRAYLVMELLSGETLSQRLQRHKRLSLEATVTMIRQLAGAIGAAHQRGIVHRDLKPDNIFLVPDPEMPNGERVKVLDFGLAKLLEVAFPGGELTAQGSVFGTPAYMAPEQCRSSGNVDQRADLYAIGCIFYMCLCGHAPFGTGGIEVLLAQVSQAPVPPRRHAPDLPVEIEELILQLLAKDPDRRLPSCETFIAQLDRVVERLPEVFSRKSHSIDELTMRDNPTLQGALAFAVKHVPDARADADRAPALPGLGRNRDDSSQQPRRAPGAPRAEPTQHLTTQALMPLDVEEDTDRISVPARHGIAGPMSRTALTPVDDAEPLSDDSVELIDDEQVAASERETAKMTARDAVHLRPTEKLSARSPMWAKETQRMRPGTGVDMGVTQPLTRGTRRGTDMTVRPLPGVPETAGQRPLPGVSAAAPGHSPEISPARAPVRPDEVTHALPGVPGLVDGVMHASPGVPGPTDEAGTAAPAARARGSGAALRAPAQAMQLRALPWEPDAPSGPEGSAQPPGEHAEQGERAGRASTPTLSSGELERRPRPEPRRRADRRALWAAAGVLCLGGLILAGMLMGKSDNEASKPQPVVEPVDELPTEPSPEDSEENVRLRKIDDLLHQAEQAMDAKDWDRARNLLEEARTLGIIEAQGARLNEMARRMGAEKDSQAVFERLRAAAEKQRIDDVAEELDKIPEDSVYRAEARAVALEAMRSRIARLLRRGDCKELARVVAKAGRALPDAKDELEAQTASCVQAAADEASASASSGKRDAAQIYAEARDAYKRNLLLTASRHCEELRDLGQVNSDATTLCGTVACKTKNRATAKWYHGRAPVGSQARSLIAQTCLKEGGFDVQK